MLVLEGLLVLPWLWGSSYLIILGYSGFWWVIGAYLVLNALHPTHSATSNCVSSCLSSPLNGGGELG